MLRLITPLIVIATAIAAAPAGASGAYTQVLTSDAPACARACADDGICMAWTFRNGGACELTAIAPSQAPGGTLAFGLSPRAPAFAQMRALTQVAAAQASAEPTAQTLVPQALTPAPIEVGLAPVAAEEDALVLLGGPEDEADLRLQLTSPR